MILGIGTDWIDLEEMRRALERGGERLRSRVFTVAERRYCEGRRREVEHLAARFAAKEAAFKALGTGWGSEAGWSEVEVRRGRSGAPSLRLSGKAAASARRRGIRRFHVSLSHSGRGALAVVIAEG